MNLPEAPASDRYGIVKNCLTGRGGEIAPCNYGAETRTGNPWGQSWLL